MTLPSRSDVKKHITILRLSAGAALVGCCSMGLVMGFAGYRGEELESWRMLGAAMLFVPVWGFSVFGKPGKARS